MANITWGINLHDGVTPNLKKISAGVKVTSKDLKNLGLGAMDATVKLQAFNSQAAVLATKLNRGMSAGLINGNKNLSKTATLMGQTSRAVQKLSGSADTAKKSVKWFR